MLIRRPTRALALVAATAHWVLAPSHLLAARALGIDASVFQGNIDWSTVRNQGGVEFAFIRSSRGGTTSALGQYFDPNFNTNMRNATNVGILAGPYHFTRPDLNPTAAGGTDNAQQFINAAKPWMRGGFLRPVIDLEDGDTETTPAQLTTWAIAFADRIYQEIGVYPIFYSNSNYVTNEVAATSSDGTSLMSRMPDLWLARPAGSTNPQTGQPPTPSGYANPYGRWSGQTPPWKFWQYALDQPNGTMPGVNAGIDLNVANGDIDFVKDFLIPAMLKSDADASWNSTSTWNLDAVVISGSTYFPARTPNSNDTVVLNRTAGNPVVTLASGAQTIRKLQASERLSITGGSLTVLKTASIANALTLSAGAGFSAGESLTVTTAGSLNFSNGGSITAASISLSGPVNYTADASASGAAINRAAGSTGSLDLASGNRTFTVADAPSAADDLTVNFPLANGSLTKSGPGTLKLALAGTYTGTTTVTGGTLAFSAPAALGDAASVIALSNGASLRTDAPMSLARPVSLGAGGGGAIDTNGNAVSLTGTLSGSNPFTKSGAGTLTLSSATYTGATNITGGTLALAASNLIPDATPVTFDNNATLSLQSNLSETIRNPSGAGRLSIAGGATLTANVSFPSTLTGPAVGNGTLVKTGTENLTLGGFGEIALAVNAGSVTLPPNSSNSTLSSLSLAPGTYLDIADNPLRLLAQTPADKSAAISLLASAYANGRWDQPGLTSSLAGAPSHYLKSLGYVPTASDLYLQIRLTWLGDANLDGLVNQADLASLDPAGTTWSQGDFNYDGRVSPDDYALLALGLTNGSTPAFSSAVPEPTTLALLALTSTISLTRIRRRHP